MPFRLLIFPSAAKTIASWGLSDSVLVDVYLYLREILPLDPAKFLRRAKQPFDGMLFEFNVIDPDNRLRQHFFVFQILYSQDEENLIVAKAGYERRDGI